MRFYTNEQIFTDDSTVSHGLAKARILKDNLLPYKCSECSVSSWNGKELILQIDHINGKKSDNRMENLRLLCPNCHSQTDSFCGRNINKYVAKYCKCGSIKKYYSIRCRKCDATHRMSLQLKIKWPDNEKLVEMIQKSSFLAVSKQLGVSDNAIRKRLKKRGLFPV